METLVLNDRARRNIRAELARREITQEQFADLVGMGRTAAIALLAGRTNITLSRLETVARALRIPATDLLIAHPVTPTTDTISKEHAAHE